MLTSILERGSWFIYKFGMPLVYFYHLIIGSVFFNTAAEDATGLEKLADAALIPMQYFFEGKVAVQEGEEYQFERRFDYKDKFFLKTAASTTLLPLSITVGGALKAVSYLDPKTKRRAKKIYAARHGSNVHSNKAYYESIGIQINDFRKSEPIDPPKWRRQPGTKNRLAGDVEALKEIVKIFSKYEIPFWMDCGSCLGTYQYGGCIPGDWDVDIAVLKKDFDNIMSALQELDPKKYIVQDWSGRANPKSYSKVYVRETGGMIDLYNFEINEEKKQINTLLSNRHNIFSPKDWVQREERYCMPMPFDRVFPLKKATFEGIEVPVPGNIVVYLQDFYGKNISPARVYNEVTNVYEKDPTHPYWQSAHAH